MMIRIISIIWVDVAVTPRTQHVHVTQSHLRVRQDHVVRCHKEVRIQKNHETAADQTVNPG
eukprot:3255344-Rhodomonas_salina.1